MLAVPISHRLALKQEPRTAKLSHFQLPTVTSSVQHCSTSHCILPQGSDAQLIAPLQHNTHSTDSKPGAIATKLLVPPPPPKKKKMEEQNV